MHVTHQLPFERPIYELEEQLRQLEANPQPTPNIKDAVRKIRVEISRMKRDVFDNLDAWDVVKVARHPERPQTRDYIELVFDEFMELHGDKSFGDDRALITGFARLDDRKVMLIGQQKGRTLKERNECYYGCAHPEGYRKALAKMQTAAKFRLPIVCLIDTPGAYPGIGAEERGQAYSIALNLREMSQLPTPIVCVVIGEGGSGGALGIGVGDRVAILEHAYYSVISPEGCAGILWKSHTFAEQAAKALKITSRHLLELGVVDDVIEEPLGGAHRDHHQMAGRLKMYLLRTLRELVGKPLDELINQRYQRFRHMGVFFDDTQPGEAAPEPAAVENAG